MCFRITRIAREWLAGLTNGIWKSCDNIPIYLGGEVLEKYRQRIVYGSDFPNLLFPRKSEILWLLSFGLSKEFYYRIF